MSNVKANRTHSQHCHFKSELIRSLRPGSGAAASFPRAVRVEPFVSSVPGPPPVALGGPRWLKLSHKRASSFALTLAGRAEMIISRPDVD